MKGIIKSYNRQKGYGFITTEDESDIYFHISQIKNSEITPEEGLCVLFDTQNTHRGIQATHILIKCPSSYSQFIALGDMRIKCSNIKEYGIQNQSEDFLKQYDYAEQIERYDRELASYTQQIQFCYDEILSLGGSEADAHRLLNASEIGYHLTGMLPRKNSITGQYDLNRETVLDSLMKEKSKLIYLRDIASENKQKYVQEFSELRDSDTYKLAVQGKLESLYIITYQKDEYILDAHDCGFDIREKLQEIDQYLLSR